MKCVVTVTLTLLAFVTLNEAFTPFAPEPRSIRQLLRCMRPPIRNQSTENIPVIPIVPAPTGSPWVPLNGTAPLYHEDYDLIFTDTELRESLIEHIGPLYRNMTEPITLVTRTPMGQVIQRIGLLQPDGCPTATLESRYPNVTTTDITSSFIDVILDCEGTFSYGNRIPYYFPPWHVQLICAPPAGDYCSVPIGATCVYNLSCNYNLPVLMWDCCWTWETSAFVYECGWRNVLVPVGTDCLCSC